MIDPVALAVCFPDTRALASGWDVVAGTLAVPGALPGPGTPVLLDGRVGEVAFLLGGSVVPGPGGTRLIEVDAAGRPVVEALLEPAVRRRKRAVA